ncbi:Uncharacterized conserved protein [Phaffia rhodozyma]|uniref:Sugar phosphate phosphatase n=1 Tax=Phaffia rhodozyma TaxID=264483 RepID=A0A0F7SVK7_PHARH|nr:Uncharacterized conserved protein [Phaffia rhodozyma]
MSTYDLPVPRWGFDQEGTFARATVITRWPVIIKDTRQSFLNASLTTHTSTLAVSQVKTIVDKTDDLLEEITSNSEFHPLVDDGEPNVGIYNEEVERLKKEGKKTWHQLPWLWAECFLYRKIRNFVAVESEWKTYDPYFTSKIETFRSSSKAVVELAHSLLALAEKPPTTLDELQPIFSSMLQMCLWGNATDLSLLAGGATEESLQALQSRGIEEKKFILRDDESPVWEWCKRLESQGGKKQVDFVLDNAGFELFTDMVFADFLISMTPFFDHAVFHPKTIPWFVSDVLPTDFRWILSTLSNPSSFFTSTSLNEADFKALTDLAARWQSLVDKKAFDLSVPLDTELGSKHIKSDFWTTSAEYQRMEEFDGVLGHEKGGLGKSSLVVFKGDLNYRKLTADAQWKTTEPFDKVLGPINGRIPILSLRTNKAEVIVGLAEGVEERTVKEDPKWRVNGKYAVVSFAPQT